VERFAYINIEPSNGGSVLNVSEGGLCFHSIAPIHRSETIRFWFWEQDHRIEVQCDLVWVDKTQKTGGLRFTNLPQDARESMLRWKTLPTPIAPDQASPVSTLLRRATPALGTSRPEPKSAPDSSEPSSMVSRDAKAQAPFTAFSGGLATGLLVSALVAAPFLFRSYKGQLGESLIHWGERFAARPHSQVQSVSPPPPADSPPASQKTVAASRLVLPAATSLPRLRSKKLLPEQVKKTANPQPAHTARETPTPATSTPTAILAPKASAAAIATTASKTPLPAAPVAAASNVTPAKPELLSPLEPAGRNYIQNARAENSASSSQLYFEVGKFKNAVSAYRATDTLARLGFRATVVEKGHFWTNSYHVLVGPYGDDNAEEIRMKLMSSGFKPQVFERGSRNLTIYGGCDTMGRLLRSERTPRGVQIELEDCALSWETYSTHAMVTFAQENTIVATADGKWVKRGIRYKRDAFVYRKNDDGSQTLIEIQFAGMSHALVFNES
jgi:PilZ domain-containing protein